MGVHKATGVPRSGPSLDEKPVSVAFVGALAGPFLGILFLVARIGPAGLIWWEGKGGETIPTSLGRITACLIIVLGAWTGALCALVLEARYRPGIAAAKLKHQAPKEHLWDHELDG